MLESLLIEKSQTPPSQVIPDVKVSSSNTVPLLKDTQGITRENFKQFSHLHLLIVEDNSMNQKILKGVFAPSGMSISIANNGLEALEEVKKNSELDLIFMDTNMPVMDGYEATKQIRKFRSEKMLPIIAIESIGFTRNTHEIDGINAFLHKPFKIGQLYTALMAYTSQKQSTVKHVMHKLSKYEHNNVVLDIQKGISHANTAIFYKEVLSETSMTLKHSDNVIESHIMKAEYKELKSFMLDTIRLSEIIGATGLRKILIEMMQTFDYKQKNKLQDYISLYKKELTLLKSEISEYLKT
jgi:CheY-like chemotaxis protein